MTREGSYGENESRMLSVIAGPTGCKSNSSGRLADSPCYPMVMESNQ